MSEQQSPLARRARSATEAHDPDPALPGNRSPARQVDAVLLSMVGVTLFVGVVIWFVFRALHPVQP